MIDNHCTSTRVQNVAVVVSEPYRIVLVAEPLFTSELAKIAGKDKGTHSPRQ